MKTITCTLFLFLITAFGYAQIGINTENPKGLLHIDGASSPATINPASGNISDIQASDDVIINNSGYVGIGTIAPTTKLHIKGDTPGVIRISDTTEGVNRMLFSDANGVGTWGIAAGSWFALLRGSWPNVYQTGYTMRLLNAYSDYIISNPLQGSVDLAAGSIKIPFSGNYRVTLSGHWSTNRVGTSNPYYIGPTIYVNGVAAWSGATIGYSNVWGSTPSFIAILDLAANDELSIYNDETTNNRANMINSCFLVVEYLF